MSVGKYTKSQLDGIKSVWQSTPSKYWRIGQLEMMSQAQRAQLFGALGISSPEDLAKALTTECQF